MNQRIASILLILFGFLFGAAATAAIVLLTAQPHGEAITIRPAPTPAPLQVDITGAVNQPGVYTLPRDSRVQDAIQAAGGLSAQADSQRVNLVAKLKDGEKLVVPQVGQAAEPAPPPAKSVEIQPDGAASTSDEPPADSNAAVNLNTATLDELQTLAGIGPTKAEAIIAYREAHGGFKSIEEITQVSGIGPATFENIKSRLTVE